MLPVDLKDASRDIDGTLIKASDKQVLGSPVGLSIAPTTTDVILLDGAFVGEEYQERSWRWRFTRESCADGISR